MEHQIVTSLSELSGIPVEVLCQFFQDQYISITEELFKDQRLLNKLLDEKDIIMTRYERLVVKEKPTKTSPRASTTSIEKSAIPLIGEKNAMVHLRNEYKNPTIISKIEEFEHQGFSQFRSIRGDGNCFYRSVATGLIECIIKNEELYEHIFAVLQHQKEGLDEETYGHLLKFMAVVNDIHHPQHKEELNRDATDSYSTSNGLLPERSISDALPPSDRSVNCFQVPDSRDSGEEESLVESHRDEDSMVIVDDKDDEREPLIPKREDQEDLLHEDRMVHDAAPVELNHDSDRRVPSELPPTSSVNDWTLINPDLTKATNNSHVLNGIQETSPLSRETETNEIPLPAVQINGDAAQETREDDRVAVRDEPEQRADQAVAHEDLTKKEVPKSEPAVPVAKIDIDELSEKYATDIELSQWFVKAFRQLSAFALQRDPTFSYYLSEGQTIDSLCETALKMGEDAEQLQMIALFSTLKIGCQAFQLDRENNNASYILPDESATPLIYLLFRPGHYDLLYKA